MGELGGSASCHRMDSTFLCAKLLAKSLHDQWLENSAGRRLGCFGGNGRHLPLPKREDVAPIVLPWRNKLWNLFMAPASIAGFFRKNALA